MEPESYLRVNSALLSQFTDKFVALPGKVLTVNQSTVLIESADKGQVTVHLNQSPNFTTKAVEILGTVKPDGTLSMMSFTCWDDDMDFDSLNQVIRMQFDHLEVFQD